MHLLHRLLQQPFFHLPHRADDGNLHLPPCLDLPLGAEVAMSALLAILAPLLLPKPRARPAHAGSVQSRSDGGHGVRPQQRRLGQERGGGWTEAPIFGLLFLRHPLPLLKGIGAVVVLHFHLICPPLFVFLFVLTHQGQLRLLARLDLPLRAKVAVVALLCILATLRLPEPGARPAHPHGMKRRAHGGQPVQHPGGRHRRRLHLGVLGLVLALLQLRR
mmetsp:Transcript_11767/g.24853  ORF Transcript_11767/g.24853 Transcript_11767/m.24853 type:complete len:218 (-) Transcript_11767:224-877(-)